MPVGVSLCEPIDIIDKAERLLGRVVVDSMPAGGSGLTDTELRNSPLSVTGTFWQTTQPVCIASMPSTPVTGSFWQATQPVSIAATVTTTALTDAQLRASAVKAREDSAAMTWASVKSAAPLASAVQATTGALAAGDWDFDIFLVASDTVAVGKGLVVEHRNAADNATLQTLGGVVAGVSGTVNLRRYTMATNERIRVIAGTAAGAASSMYVSAIGRRLT